MPLGLKGMETMKLNSALTEIVVLGKALGVTEYADILEKRVFHLSLYLCAPMIQLLEHSSLPLSVLLSIRYLSLLFGSDPEVKC